MVFRFRNEDSMSNKDNSNLQEHARLFLVDPWRISERREGTLIPVDKSMFISKITFNKSG